MTNEQIKTKFTYIVKEERRNTNELLELILLATQRRSYLDFGFANMFDWLTRGLGYSQGAAQRRIDGARLLKLVPEAREKTADSGLTSISRVQTAIRAEKKMRRIPAEDYKRAIAAVKNLTRPDAEKKLCEIILQARAPVQQEKRVTIDENTIRHSMTLPKETTADLMRAKKILSHRLPKASDAEVVAYALNFLLEKADPLRRATSETKSGFRRAIYQAAKGQCAFIDPHTGKRCNRRYQMQIDHRLPRALGGEDKKENLRLLCRQHSRFEAERILGRRVKSPYWKKH